jgi:ribose/xylose/arabinose/galactoside ABC-type transport system permease subunit
MSALTDGRIVSGLKMSGLAVKLLLFLLIFLLLLPAIALWLVIRLAVHRRVFVRSMKAAGMPPEAARHLGKEMSPWKGFL